MTHTCVAAYLTFGEGWGGELAAMTAHKVSTWENRCGEINTSSHGFSPRRTEALPGLVKYCGVVLRKRSLACGCKEIKSFVRHSKMSKAISGTQNCVPSLKNRTKIPGPSGHSQECLKGIEGRTLMALKAS